MNNLADASLVWLSTLQMAKQIFAFKILEYDGDVLGVFVHVEQANDVWMGSGPKYINLIHLQDQFLGLQALLVDLLASDYLVGDSVPALEDLAVGALPKDLVGPSLIELWDWPQFGRLVQPLHPEVALLRSFQEEYALIYLGKFNLYLPVPNPIYFFVGKLLLEVGVIQKGQLLVLLGPRVVTWFDREAPD